MKVLVTGGAGYIGSVLVRKLLNAGHTVRVIDSLKFGGEALYDVMMHPQFEFIKGDIRNAEDVAKALQGMEAVAHLAAIVGDPACKKFSDEARDTNWNGSVALFEAAEKAGVQRFVFASTCSNYGKMADADSFVTETSALKPVSLYAELKVQFENYLLNDRKDAKMCSTALRFSTVYGFSPRIRFDLTVNEFTRNAAIHGEQEIWGAQFWRPYCHVDDLARSVVLVLESDESKVRANVFNVGSTEENYNKGMIIEEVCKVVPNTRVHYVESAEDPRDYRVNFDKIKNELGYTITKTVPDGVREIYTLLKTGIVIDPFAEKFRNI
ncbi:MAG TPA: NAD(P)-dependent oxidoreductase [Ferruginibacter sp.]|nr:NAD(P)-dependent oxidoreductase [Ferruginibacter sp.]HRO05960.1 NAD(P)-dependent oxidoreductase [Ferruginibacter sp.]HRO97223.1 NAD(P)-dependent oxidoreductase [Ferruginibacter sp.]HRP49046.1 NAD(P)-dependent oxidoreductase [Ferruginibacter sp.]